MSINAPPHTLDYDSDCNSLVKTTLYYGMFGRPLQVECKILSNRGNRGIDRTADVTHPKQREFCPGYNSFFYGEEIKIGYIITD